ncbi:ATP-dependent RNA helicase VCA0990 [Vibrio maritimus]|uniref:ATP-dependent RNA helicase VCA0990 n=1 Tax=Vibrio maritimus TaxID=990268 RepID=A0A090TDF7_9VIBR|nr:ATP-dependent RNA helicase VCA0990 [Vibrio maritimus]
MPFSQFSLSQKLVAALPDTFRSATEIQTIAIPAILNQQDVLAIAKTGSGKTLAYGLPLLEQLLETPSQALILVPTRELASQVNDTLSQVTQDTELTSISICGGADKEQQKPLLPNNQMLLSQRQAACLNYSLKTL